MTTSLPARPNLDHLRHQAKALLAGLKQGDAAAARAFIDHLPEARGLTPAKAAGAGFRLADAQSVVARRSGFDKWPDLAHHVEQLRSLEGEWRVVALQVDGDDMPPVAFGQARLLIDGDRFRMESPGANYDGVFTIDVSQTPAQIDITFVEGPEAGNRSLGIYDLDRDQLTMCLGLTGASRPAGFSTRRGSGHALERFRRASAERPERVTGGVAPARAAAKAPVADRAGAAAAADATAFDGPMTPLLTRLDGDWLPTRLVSDGEEMRADWLAFGSRTANGREVTVRFGGQVMLHVKVRIDERTVPVSIDYLHLSGGHTGGVSLGIMDWVGDEPRFLIAPPGQPRPASMSDGGAKGHTLSQWKRG